MVAAEIFHDRVCASGRCWLADNREDHVCDGPLEAHHVPPKSFIFHAFRARLTERALLAIMYAPEIGLPVCSGGHAQITSRYLRIAFEELPAELTSFARDAGILGRVLIECPRQDIGGVR